MPFCPIPKGISCKSVPFHAAGLDTPLSAPMVSPQPARSAARNMGGAKPARA